MKYKIESLKDIDNLIPKRSVKEKWVKSKVKEILVNYGAYYFMPQTGGFGKSGVPDFVGCFKGKFIAIETKVAGNPLTELQKIQIDAINNAQGIAIVITEENLGVLDSLLRSIK